MGGRALLCSIVRNGVRQVNVQASHMCRSEFESSTIHRTSNFSSDGLVRNRVTPCVGRVAGFHASRRAEYAHEPTYGVGPVLGGDRDPKTKGDTPDDFRALDIHAAEPKEITKEAAAEAMQEPPDFQMKKIIPEESKPFERDADPQETGGGKAFEEKTRKQEGTAQYQGDTTGTEKSGHEVEGQYGAGPDEGKTTRA